MSGSVDDLIADLFPNVAPLKQQSSFDDPTPKKQTKPAAAAATSIDESYDETTTRPSGAEPCPIPERAVGTKTTTSFDDSDDDDDTGATSRPLHPHVMVPFPDFPPGLVPNASGNNSCTLSCVGNPRVFHPTVEALRAVEQHGTALLHMPRQKVLTIKGAIHATHPEAGNGVDPQRGSAFVVCRRCDHGVVRLQGARWLDGADGSRDMYLAVRNFYPDWSRLAHCNGTHSEMAAKAVRGPLLAADAGCAAYCCQCSWMTVDAEAFTVTTLPGEVAAACGAVFRTATTDGVQEDRRPPLWRSRGVISDF
jgi:hypothetical protein